MRTPVTKEDLKPFATKEDLKAFATKEDLKSFATKEDLKSFATKDELKNELKNQLKKYATKDDIRMVIDHIDSYFVRDHRLKTVESKIVNHESRIQLLEQR